MTSERCFVILAFTRFLQIAVLEVTGNFSKMTVYTLEIKRNTIAKAQSQGTSHLSHPRASMVVFLCFFLISFFQWTHVALGAQKIFPPGSTDGHGMGGSISISGTFAAVGIAGSNFAFNRSGGVFLCEYQPSGTGGAWQRLKTLVPEAPDPGYSGTYFGTIVALRGDFLAVGSLSKVRIFERNFGGNGNWGLKQVLAVTPQSLVMDGSRLLVGVSGHAEVYDRESVVGTWTKTGQFGIGKPAALSGNSAVIVREDAFSYGNFEIYEKESGGNWTQTKWFHSPEYRDNFGGSISLVGNSLVVGASSWASGVDTSGKVYVYKRDQGGPNAWGLMQTLLPFGPAHGFGAKVSLSGSKIAVGMEGSSQEVQVFSLDGAIIGRFLPSIPHSESFGRELAIEGDFLLASDIWPATHGASFSNSAGFVSCFDVHTGNPARVMPESQVLDSEPSAGGDQFGLSLAMHGSTLATGSEYAEAVNIYSKSIGGQWTFLKRLSTETVGQNSYFGNVITLDADTLAVLGQHIEIFGRHEGGAENWGRIKEISGNFSDFLALDGDTLAACAYSNGSCIYERNLGGPNQWQQAWTNRGTYTRAALNGNTLVLCGSSSAATIVQRSAAGTTDWRITAGFSTPYPFYMLNSVSLSGDTVVFGGFEDLFGGTPPGTRPPETVIVCRRDQGGANHWGEVTRIAPPDRTGRIGFGKSLRLLGDILVIGAPDDTTQGAKGGSVYVYKGSSDKSTWTLISKSQQADSASGDMYGATVATNGTDVVGAAPLHSALWPASGAAYVSPLANHFGAWVSEHAPAAPPNSALLDLDGDGMNLFTEYALNLDPLVPELSPTRLSPNADGSLSFEYPVGKDAAEAQVDIEWSLDLTVWHPATESSDAGLTITSTIANETMNSWLYRTSVRSAPGIPRLFLRLNVKPRQF